MEKGTLKGKEECVHEKIRRRCIRRGHLLIETNMTVREITKKTRYPKRTVHRDLTQRLPKVDQELSENAAEILAYHKAIRNIRGEEATRQKWLHHNKLKKES